MHGLHRQPGKGRVPFGKQQRMPQTAYTAITIGKGMDQFQLIVEHTTADQHVYVAVLDPVQQLHDQIRNILRQRAEMQDMSLLIYDPHRSGAKHT